MNQMKKLSILLAIVSLMIVVTACNRRDKYRNPELTGSEEVSSGTVTGADSDTNLPQGEGNPYQNMTAEELLTLYQETLEHSRISTPHAFDTPYYYIFASDTAYTGGQAYSKLTGQIVTLWKDMTCSHKGEVINTSAVIAERVVLKTFIILRASMRKKCMFLSADITADIPKRQVSVRKSKYPKYSLSGGTKKHDTIASIVAITSTALLRINPFM